MHLIAQDPDLEQLFRETSGDLARYFSRRHGGDIERANDLVQDTFVEMAKGLQKGNSILSPRAYLFGIARRVSQAAWTRRRQERHLAVAREDWVDANPPASSEMGDRAIAAHEVIAGLPPLQREILELRFTQQLSYAEIAEALSIPVGTVRSRLHHAVARVRERLNPPETNELGPT